MHCGSYLCACGEIYNITFFFLRMRTQFSWLAIRLMLHASFIEDNMIFFYKKPVNDRLRGNFIPFSKGLKKRTIKYQSYPKSTKNDAFEQKSCKVTA